MWSYNQSYSDILIHHGIKGQKWGIRRYQNADGSLTAAGKKRAYKAYVKNAKKSSRDKEGESYQKEYRAKSDYEAGIISKDKYDKTVFKETRKRLGYQRSLNDDLAAARKEYDISRGKNAKRSERKYQRALRRSDYAFQEEDFNNIVNLAKNNQRVAQSLLKSGDIKLDDLQRANIIAGMELVGDLAESSRRKK